MYDYSKIDDFERTQLPEGFTGNVYNLSYKWLDIIPEPTTPIRILEIGSYHGANVCSLLKTYAKDPKSEIHCVDPWRDYEEYPEYKNKQPTNYSIFLNNISKLDPIDINKIYIHRMLSSEISFNDEYFDIIYIDGNHERKFVLEDAMISLKKLKPGGWIVFDDLQDKQVVEGVELFLTLYMDQFQGKYAIHSAQLFIQRKVLPTTISKPVRRRTKATAAPPKGSAPSARRKKGKDIPNQIVS